MRQTEADMEEIREPLHGSDGVFDINLVLLAAKEKVIIFAAEGS